MTVTKLSPQILFKQLITRYLSSPFIIRVPFSDYSVLKRATGYYSRIQTTARYPDIVIFKSYFPKTLNLD